MEELRKPTTELEFKQMYEGVFEDVTKFMIVAGEYRNAFDFARAMRIPREEWKYVSEISDLHGRKDFVIVTLGGVNKKNKLWLWEILEFSRTLADRGFAKIVHVEDWR